MDTIDNVTLSTSESAHELSEKEKKLDKFQDLIIAEHHELDEMRAISSDKINSVSINASFVNVSVKSRKSRNIVAHLSGEIITEGTIDFDFLNEGTHLTILTQVNGNLKIINSLNLEVEMPYRLFKDFSFSSNFHHGHI